MAPAHPHNDGRQTPWHNHPMFVAQHATTTCCRKCLSHWRGLPGREFTADEQRYIPAVIERWLQDSPDG